MVGLVDRFVLGGGHLHVLIDRLEALDASVCHPGPNRMQLLVVVRLLEQGCADWSLGLNRCIQVLRQRHLASFGAHDHSRAQRSSLVGIVALVGCFHLRMVHNDNFVHFWAV